MQLIGLEKMIRPLWRRQRPRVTCKAERAHATTPEIEEYVDLLPQVRRRFRTPDYLKTGSEWEALPLSKRIRAWNHAEAKSTSAWVADRMIEPVPPASGVYFMVVGRRVKIGVSRNVASRVSSHQTSSADPVTVVAIAPGGEAVERAYHRQLESHHVRGEWFILRPEVEAEIDKIRALGEWWSR